MLAQKAIDSLYNLNIPHLPVTIPLKSYCLDEIQFTQFGERILIVLSCGNDEDNWCVTTKRF